jgi:hypothetical protein
MRRPQLSPSKTALGGTPKPHTHDPSAFQRLPEPQFGQLCLREGGGGRDLKKRLRSILCGADGVVVASYCLLIPNGFG